LGRTPRAFAPAEDRLCAAERFPRGQDFPASVKEIVEANLYAQTGLFRLPGRTLKAQAADALRLVGMEGFEKRPISQLSGGQQQRVMLRGRTRGSRRRSYWTSRPGVDASTVESLYALLKKLNRKQRLTVLMVTHDVCARRRSRRG
jgi:zinc transport system ATP-binding protein